MQNLKEPLYYSNFRPGFDVELDDDRELLVEEQKSCRARARKFCLETNRRRKALEERRRQWDVQEQRLREKILQQRKQRVQDATERFQRAHLPPSLRRRPGSGKRVPNLDEALGQIHGSLGSFVQHSLISRSCTPSPKPPGGSSGPHSRRVVSAAEAYSRLMQERSLSEFKSSQLIFLNQLQETEHQAQEHPDTPPSPSESLSSLDSLENEIPQQGHGTSPAQSSSFLDPPGVQNVQNPVLTQQLNLLTQSKSFLEEVLGQQGSPSSSSSSSSPSLGESADSADSADDEQGLQSLQSLQDLTQALELCNLNDQSESFYTQSTPCCQNVHAQQDLTTNSGHMAYCYDSTVRGNASRECKTLHVEPDTTPLEFASLTRQEPKLLGRTLEEKCTKHPSENRPFQPVDGCRHKNDLSQASSSASRIVASNVDAAGSSLRFNGSCQVSQLDSSNSANSQFCKNQKPDADKANQKESKLVNHGEKCRNEDPSNLREECTNRRIVATSFKPFKSSRIGEEPHKTSENPAIYGEKSKNEEDPSNLPNECTNRTLANTMSSKPTKSSRTGEEPDQTSKAYLSPTTTTRCTDVRFLKGILKKNSKYMVGDAKFTQTYTAGNFVFTRQVAMSIRDSMELTRAKVREPENDKSVKKKLRWFDEVNGDEDIDNVKNKPGHLPQQAPSSMDANHQQELYQLAYTNAPTGTLGRIGSTTASTRQAWTDVKTQEEEPTQEPKEPKEPKIQRTGPRITGPRIPRRVCSARNAVSGPTAPRNRKGTVIRPQSATEAQRVLKNQSKGKTLVPRPPPRSDQILESQFNSAEPTVYITTKTAYNPWDSDCPHSKPDGAHPDTQPTSSQHHCLRAEGAGALLAPPPAPPSYSYAYETVSKGIYALCQPEAQTGSARRPLQFRENGICLDRTPTDEEISLLWHGVRSALASKEGDPRSFLAPSGPLSALPQGRANVSHVTINGDSLLSGVKAVTRMGHFFLSPSNARTPVRRPTVESNMVKNRDKKHQLIYQATVPISGYSSKADQTAQDEDVLDSGVQVAVDVSQLQRAGVVHRGQVFGLSALSLEEQRLLQSLDRLNHRLQYVQDMSAGNAALKGVFTVDSANNQSPQTGEVLGGTQRRYHNGSAAENRTRSHRRY